MAGLLGCDRHGRTLRGLGGLGNLIGGGKTETGGLQQNERLGSNSSQWGLSAPRQKHTENEKDGEGVREEEQEYCCHRTDVPVEGIESVRGPGSTPVGHHAG